MGIFVIRHGKRKLAMLGVLFAVLLFFTAQSLGNRIAANGTEAARILPIYGTDDDSMRLSVTFNCAWGAADIPEILDILDRYQVKATFFVVGTWAEKYPDAVRAIYTRGHEIGNHSYSHRLPSQSSAEQLETEIRRCNDVVESITGERPVLYRAPSGDYNTEVVKLAEKLGMYAIKWSADSVDWKKDVSKTDLMNRILNGASSGGILLFHNDTQYTVSALPTILESLQARGFRFVTVSDLIYMENYEINAQGIQIKKH